MALNNPMGKPSPPMTPTSEERKHTPLPWRLATDGFIHKDGVGVAVYKASPSFSEEVLIANGNFIVTAVNSYYSLKEDNQKLREGLKKIKHITRYSDDHDKMLYKVKEAHLLAESLLEESKPLNS